MTTTTKIQGQAAYDLYVRACVAAEQAAASCAPTPMIVGTSKAVIGPGSKEIDYEKKTWVVAGGVCGRASVVIRPANSAFVNALKKRGVGYKNYYGGWAVPSYQFAPSTRHSQSMELAESAARSAATVLADAGIEVSIDASMD